MNKEIRNIACIACLTAADLLLFAACDNSPKPTATPLAAATRAATLVLRTPTPDVTATVRAYIPDHSAANRPENPASKPLDFYPELQKAIYKTQETQVSSLTLVNASEKVVINSTQVLKLITYFEDLIKQKRYFDYPSDIPSPYPLIIDSRPKTGQIVYLIPWNTPYPTWQDSKNGPSNAETNHTFSFGTELSFVKIPNSSSDIPPSQVFKTTESVANAFFVTEICQAALDVTSTIPIFTEEGNEIICNSMGRTYVVRQLGMSYENYAAWAKTVKFRKNETSPLFPMLILSKQDYENIPLGDLPLLLK